MRNDGQRRCKAYPIIICRAGDYISACRTFTAPLTCEHTFQRYAARINDTPYKEISGVIVVPMTAFNQSVRKRKLKARIWSIVDTRFNLYNEILYVTIYKEYMKIRWKSIFLKGEEISTKYSYKICSYLNI